MTRRYLFSLLGVLTVAIVVRLALAWWPDSTPVIASAKKMASTPVAEAQENSAPANAAQQTPATSATLSPAKKTEDASKGGQSSLIPDADASVFPGIPGDNMTPQEIEVLQSLKSIKKQLDARAKKLDARQKAAEAAEAKADAKITELEKLEANIQDLLQQENSVRNKKIKRLAAVYDGMKAQKAAPVIAGLDLATVVKVFSNMDEKQVGKILTYLPPDEAVKISRALTENVGSLKQ